jgi:urease accessory protein
MNTNEISAEEISIMQMSDSFFPTGMYTMSNGLEALFYVRKVVNDPNSLRDLIRIYLEYQIGPADCTALGNSYEYSKKTDIEMLSGVDQTLFSMKLIREIREATTRSGTQLIRTVSSFISDSEVLNGYGQAIKRKEAYGVYAVALAVVCSALGISKQNAGLIMLYSFSVSIVGAALRLGVLQHIEGQRIIHELKPTIVKTVLQNIDRPVTSMWQFAPDIDILQIAHEKMDSKMFIT